MANVVSQKDLHRICLTAIIYNDEGNYLITKRSLNQIVHPGKWEVPGGGVETSDYINTQKTTETAWYEVLPGALKREVKEETNLEIDRIEYLTDLIFIRPDGIPVLVLSYFAHTSGGEVILEEGGATEYAWVTAEEAEKYELIDGVLDEIRMAETILKAKRL
jgi:8-oxo-dGTP pyrophosphatase MutT (NUDIX family)